MLTSKTASRAAALALFTLITAAVQAQPVWKDGVLTDADGRTLYTFDKDQANKSNCAGGCLQAWPAYVAEPRADAPAIPGVNRFEQNGVQQWAYQGRPLYYFAGDAKPGDRNGDGKGGVWHLAKPASNATPVSSGYGYGY